jgi:transposase
VRRTIRNVGARLVFLPKYSPDLNPIEQVFAKFKNSVAKGRGAKFPSHLRRKGAATDMLGLTLSRATPRLYRFQPAGARKPLAIRDGLSNR